jgi:hypothetical protein
MNNNGQEYLEQLASLPPNTFDSQFSRNASRMGLGSLLGCNELKLLYDAAFLAILCNIAFNGLGVYGGQIRPEKEHTRTSLERQFMEARDILFASPGWQSLGAGKRSRAERLFLNVFVAETSMAQ